MIISNENVEHETKNESKESDTNMRITQHAAALSVHKEHMLLAASSAPVQTLRIGPNVHHLDDFHCLCDSG